MIDTYVFIAVLILTSFPIEVFFLLWLNDFLLCLLSLLFGFCEYYLFLICGCPVFQVC